MATRFSNALQPTNTPVGMFQAWAQFVEDTLVTTGGWVVTSDSGQTAPGSLTVPAAANAKQGYRVYRMSDALQATAPVFMRLDFGSGPSGLGYPGMWVTIGSGSNGSGTITGITWNGGASTSPNVGCPGPGAFASNSYGSAASNRFSLGLFVTTANNNLMAFTLERTKDALGSDTGDGLMLIYRGPGDGMLSRSRYIIMAGGLQPTEEAGLAYVLSMQNPSQTFGGDIGVGPVIHFKGVAQQPGMNLVIVNSVDVPAESSFSMTLYGAARTYQHLNACAAGEGNSGAGALNDTNTRLAMRYD